VLFILYNAENIFGPMRFRLIHVSLYLQQYKGASLLKTGSKRFNKIKKTLKPFEVHFFMYQLRALVSPAVGIDISKSNVDLLSNKHYFKHRDTLTQRDARQCE
jgi:hypothetical protein